MSYSFSVRAATKAGAKEAVAAKLAEVASSQPSHQLDRAQAQAAAEAFIDVLPEQPDRDVAVSVNGSVGWSGTWGAGHLVTHAAVSVGASLITR